jgi:hypothetical protein
VQTLAVEFGDLFVRPDRVDVPAGTQLIVEVTNNGDQEHDLNLNDRGRGALPPTQPASPLGGPTSGHRSRRWPAPCPRCWWGPGASSRPPSTAELRQVAQEGRTATGHPGQHAIGQSRTEQRAEQVHERAPAEHRCGPTRPRSRPAPGHAPGRGGAWPAKGDGAAHRVSGHDGVAHTQLAQQPGGVVGVVLEGERLGGADPRPWPRRSIVTAWPRPARDWNVPSQSISADAIRPCKQQHRGPPGRPAW